MNNNTKARVYFYWPNGSTKHEFTSFDNARKYADRAPVRQVMKLENKYVKNGKVYSEWSGPFGPLCVVLARS